jgi:hypothetical protein
VEIGGDRSRGWIDLLAFETATRILLVIEVKTELHDLGALERTMNWYEREAPWAARRLGWNPHRVIGLLAFLATDANDEGLKTNRAVFDEAFPLRTRVLMELVAGSLRGPLVGSRGVAMVDPRSRRRDWLRSTRIDGRR